MPRMQTAAWLDSPLCQLETDMKRFERVLVMVNVISVPRFIYFASATLMLLTWP